MKRLMMLLFACSFAVVLLPASGLAGEAVAAEDDTVSTPIVVSLGDSYSSGEGNEPFYSQDEENKYYIEDWYAHRSELSWPGRLVVDGVQLSTVKFTSTGVGISAEYEGSWYFQASSGAVAENVYASVQEKTVSLPSEYSEIQEKTYSYSLPSEYSEIDVEVAVQIEAANKDLALEGLTGEDVDYVTMTIGGNDVGFADIITTGYLLDSTLDRDFLSEQLKQTWESYENEIEDRIAECYEQVMESYPNAQILIVGYPTLLYGSGSTTPLSFSDYEAGLINSNVREFNDALEELVIKHNEKGNLHFISVEELFDGHEAYSSDPYLYEVILGAQDEDLEQGISGIVSAYSMHPNSEDDGGVAVTSADDVNSGVTAYAWAVQQKIDELEAAESSDEDDADTSGGETNADSDTDADVALVLDVSGSMDGEPIEDLQTAALSFLDVVLDNDGTQVSITSFSYEATTLAGLTTSAAALKTGVEGLTATDSTNIEDGLRNAAALLDESESETQCIVLMSDGEPNEGLVGDELIAYAESIRDPDGDGADEVIIYALGFNVGSDAQYLLESIASDYCYYSVDDDVDTLENFFSDIGYQIAGTKFFYVEVACPVDVTVTYDGETLSSADDDLQMRTSFGSLSFKDAEVDEDGEDGDSGGVDEVKVLRLMEGATYDIEIEGTDDGTMTYTVAFADDYGLYTDTRTFSDIDVEDGTIATSSVERADTTYLEVDVDGDGKIDALYGAGANEEGEMMDNSDVMFAFFVISGAVVVLFVLIGALLLLRALLRPTARAA